MLTFKKQADRGKPGTAFRPWHPNFRDSTILPDTKVVRTAFFAKALAVLVTAAVIGKVGMQEYRLADLQNQIAAVEGQIEANKKPNAQAVALYKKFQDEEKKINDVSGFIAGNKITLSDFYYKLSMTLPPRIALKGIDYTENGVTLKGYASGTREQAPGTVSAYEKQLRENPDIGKKFEDISVTNMLPDVQNGRLSFEIYLSFTKAKKDKKP